MVCNVKYSKLGRLKSRNAIERRLNKFGFISFHQAIKIAEKYNITKRATINKIFNTLKDVDYISIWNPGNIHYFNKIRLCPMHCNTVVAKRVEKKTPRKVFHSTFCTYDASKNEDYRLMIEILLRKKHKQALTFPPLVREFFVTQDGDRRLIFWLEEKDPEELGHQGLMLGEQEDPG